MERLLYSVSLQLELLAATSGSPTPPPASSVPDDYRSLVEGLPARLSAAATAERPVVLVRVHLPRVLSSLDHTHSPPREG